MIVGKKFKFDSAHSLPNYSGKCKFMHGHTWTIEVELEDKVNDFTGMVVDFSDMDYLIGETIDELDHKVLNNIMDNPTCERIVQYLWMKFQLYFHEKLYSIKVQEGDGGWARLEKN